MISRELVLPSQEASGLMEELLAKECGKRHRGETFPPRRWQMVLWESLFPPARRPIVSLGELIALVGGKWRKASCPGSW
jgi:hypothetical protein